MPLSPYRYNAGAVAPESSGKPLKASVVGANGATPTNGQLLIGNTVTGAFELAALTAGAGITITNTAGHITIAVT